MDDQLPENPTPVHIFRIACDIRDGTANPKDANCLMELFCYFVDKEAKPIKKELFGYRPDELMPKELLWHFRDAFKAILDEGKKPEQALGLVFSVGRPKEVDLHKAIAKELLKLRISGKSETSAVMIIRNRFRREKSAVGIAWKKYRYQALTDLQYDRGKNNPWKPEEKKRLYKIFKQKENPPKPASLVL